MWTIAWDISGGAILPELEHFSYWLRVQRGPGGPRDSRPGGRRYLFLHRPATLSQAGDPLYTNMQNALEKRTGSGLIKMQETMVVVPAKG